MHAAFVEGFEKQAMGKIEIGGNIAKKITNTVAKTVNKAPGSEKNMVVRSLTRTGPTPHVSDTKVVTSGISKKDHANFWDKINPPKKEVAGSPTPAATPSVDPKKAIFGDHKPKGIPETRAQMHQYKLQNGTA